jgi:hypothetical protein
MTIEEMMETFEDWYAEEYSHSIKRGARGRASNHLAKYEGEYISDHAKDNFKVWCAAIKRMVK